MSVLKCFGDIIEIEKSLQNVENIPVYTISELYEDITITFNDISSDVLDIVISALDEFLYAVGDFTLAQSLITLLSEYDMKISTAESCTGGLLSSKLIANDGVSAYFYEGVVTYNNSAKIKRLSVSAETLKMFGAVSENVAKEMANGILCDGDSIAISTTGIAGGGGNEEKPHGLVYIGIATADQAFAVKTIFSGERNDVREKASNKALFIAIQTILDKNI